MVDEEAVVLEEDGLAKATLQEEEEEQTVDEDEVEVVDVAKAKPQDSEAEEDWAEELLVNFAKTYVRHVFKVP